MIYYHISSRFGLPVMPDTETTYLIVLIVLAVCLFVSLIFNLFFLLDMYYHIWCYGRKRFFRRRSSSCDFDSSDSDDDPLATPHQKSYAVVKGGRRIRSTSITMLNADRQGEDL